MGQLRPYRRYRTINVPAPQSVKSIRPNDKSGLSAKL